MLNGITWSALNEADYAVGPVVENLRITEIIYNPADPNTEFVELKNVGVEPINISKVSFTNGTDFTFPSHELAAGAYFLVAQNPTELAAASSSIPSGVEILGPYVGRLNDGGEKIKLADAIGQTIPEFNYKDGWYELTDGLGYSLTMVNPASSVPEDWDTKSGWRSSLYAGGTPGRASEETLAADSIVINEILAHSHALAEDWMDNDGEEIEMQIPGDLEYGFYKDGNAKRCYWIPIDKVDYKPAAPWPVSANGNGDSLNRIEINAYSRDYSNWKAATPTPGQ